MDFSDWTTIDQCNALQVQSDLLTIQLYTSYEQIA